MSLQDTYTQSNTTEDAIKTENLPSSDGGLYVFNGTQWVKATTYIWDGSGWVQIKPCLYTGSSWYEGI